MFAVRIKYLRLARELNQVQLAERRQKAKHQ